MNREERKANAIYKKMMQEASSKGTFCPFKHEYQMSILESYLEKDFKGKKNLKILDACSGEGRLLYYLVRFNNDQQYLGIDYMRPSIAKAKKTFKGHHNVSFKYGNIYHLPRGFKKKFDITLHYKTLAWLPNYKQAIREMLRVTKKKIYITSLFYDGNYDFEVRIKSHAKKQKGYIGYYIPGLSKFIYECKRLGAKKVTVKKIRLPFSLSKTNDPEVLKTYTAQLATGKHLEITGTILLDWRLVIIEP